VVFSFQEKQWRKRYFLTKSRNQVEEKKCSPDDSSSTIDRVIKSTCEHYGRSRTLCVFDNGMIRFGRRSSINKRRSPYVCINIRTRGRYMRTIIAREKSACPINLLKSSFVLIISSRNNKLRSIFHRHCTLIGTRALSIDRWFDSIMVIYMTNGRWPFLQNNHLSKILSLFYLYL